MSFNPDATHTDGLSPESALEVTSGNVVTTMIEQPKPKFTLVDLETALERIYKNNLQATKFGKDLKIDAHFIPFLVEANSDLQELIAAINKVKNNLDVIELPSDNNKAITDVINTEKPEFTVCGVNLIENGKMVGTSLYTNVIKARKIRDILNSKFAELRVNHEARISNYPVY